MSVRANGWLARLALRTCAWSERWFPDAYVFSLVILAVVVFAVLAIGVHPLAVARQFGSGYWNLVPFTMQMCFVIIGGYLTADSPPVAALSRRLARLPRGGRGAIVLLAVTSMSLSLLHWGLGLIFSSLLVRALAARAELRMDYRAAAAAAFLGTGSIWAMGLSSSAAQLQANPASMSPALLAVTGVIPFGETLFLWQSLVLTLVLAAVSAWVAWRSAPPEAESRTAADLGIAITAHRDRMPPRSRPGEWLEYSPLPNLLLAALIAGWLGLQVAEKSLGGAIANLNNYNLVFILLGLLLQWRPRRFLDAVARSVPSVAGVLIQFPIYAGIAALLDARAGDGTSLAGLLSNGLQHVTSSHSFAVVVGAYSALLGLFVPSAGGKWLIEAPYVMRVANDLHYPLGWTVQIYNAAEALPNLINPFWMLPLLGVLGLRARDLIGYTFVQFAVHLPLVLFLLWALGQTIAWHPPVMPAAP